MSNIYVQEPPTNGKVVLVTSLGDLDIELWSRECPKACRNFVQLSMEGFYNGTIFHRVVPNFIAQGGDPTGTGHGGESIYGEPFKNEIHSRLRFVRRGLVATANSGANDNESQFFFTLDACPDLQNRHTIFGKITGDTLYNMLKFNNIEIGQDDKPLYPPKIIRAEVINNPFPDIVPRVIEAPKVSKKKDKQKTKGTKNLKLLSFGEEEEEMDKELDDAPKFQSKSSHDLTNDLRLSKKTSDELKLAEIQPDNQKEQLEAVRSKLQSKASKENTDIEVGTKEAELLDSEDEKKQEAKNRRDAIRDEIRAIKRQLRGDSDRDNTKRLKEDDDEKDNTDNKTENELLAELHEEKKKYAELKKNQAPKGASREEQTLALLKKFQDRLISTKDNEESPSESSATNWLAHSLKFEAETPILAKDASTKDDNWFEITDPRNPINKRRREESKKASKDKHSRKQENL